MAELTVTLKLPFYRLNAVKAAEFERLTAVNTEVANDLLKVEKSERSKLTSSAFRHIEIGSAWINQTIRNTNAKTKVKQFQRMWLETNNQNYDISRKGDLFAVAFNLLRGRKGRIPLEVHQASHAELLDRAIAGEAKFGSIKLCKSRKGIWYALISVSMEVPDAGQVNSWIGVDRGQNNIAVAALPNGFGRFWKAGRVKSLRRRFQKLRKELQEAQKTRKVKQLERRERRMMTHINHVISKELVQFANCCNADWNAAQNIGQWIGFACPLDLQKAVAVMAMADPGDGVNDSPLTGEKSKMAALAPS